MVTDVGDDAALADVQARRQSCETCSASPSLPSISVKPFGNHTELHLEEGVPERPRRRARCRAIACAFLLPLFFSLGLLVVERCLRAETYAPMKISESVDALLARRLYTATYNFTAAPLRANVSSAKPDGFAYHKDLFPLNKWDFIGFAVSGLGLIIAAGGGIGGGGVIVPLYILLLQFRPKHAIPLSNVTILGGAIANTMFNCPKRHPSLDRPVIDWDMILIMEPATIAGAVIGSFMAKFLPDVVLTTTLTVLLVLLGWRSLSKGIEMWQQESADMSDSSDDDASSSERQSLTNSHRCEYEDNGVNGIRKGEVNEDVQEILDRETSTPWCKVLALAFCSFGCIVLTILKGGGHTNPLHVTCGSTLFWITSLATIPWVIAFAGIFRCMLLGATEEKREVGYPMGPDDFEWNEETTVRYPLICSLAGLFAGLFGVGGGIVKGPLMLEMGVKPSVASATAATMILFTTLSASVSFAVFGLVDIRYAGAVLLLGFTCTVIGQVGINALMANSGRQSPIVFSIGLVIMGSSALVGISSVIRDWGKPMSELLQPDSLCK